MGYLFKIISFIIKKINPFVRICALFASSLMFASVLLGIVTRYILNNPFSWTEELSRYSMIIMAYFGMILLLEKRENVKISFIVDKFPIVARMIIEIINDIFITLFVSILLYQGYFFVIEAKNQSTESLVFSKMYILIYIPLCASIMLLYVIKRILSNLLDLRKMRKKIKE